MNKEQYMKELDSLLRNIPESERKEALSYYEEYFDDAGVENEQQVIEELGQPSKVAANIKEGLRGSIGYQNMGTNYQNSGFQHIETQNVYSGIPEQKSGDLPTWAIVLIIIGCIILSPVILGAAGTAIGAIFSVIAGIIGLIIGLGAAGIGLVVAAVALVALGISLIMTSGFASILLIGVGLLLAAIGLLFILATVWLCGWALPTFVKWIIKLCKMPFEKKQDNVITQ